MSALLNLLNKEIAETKKTIPPRYGMCVDGYTKRSGAPTSILIRLKNEKIWRRVMVWQFSNVGTCFVRILGKEYIIPDHFQRGL